MAVLDGRTWLQHLSMEECWKLLTLSPVGRVGVMVDGAPEIYPLNYAVDQRSIVFRTDRGSKLRALTRAPAVCFEADGLDLDHRTGWSVLVKGHGEEVRSPAELRTIRQLPLRYWTPGDKDHWVRIVASEVTGRAIVPVAERPADGSDAV